MPPPVNSKRLQSTVALSALAVAALTCQFLYLKQSLIDDAYIGLGYARNFGIHFQWALVQSMPSNTATSALNVIVTGTVTAVVRDPVLACGIVYVACGMITTLALRGVFRSQNLPAHGGVIAAILILANPLMMSTIGMETVMIVALLSAALLSSVRSWPLAFGVTAALLILTRPDTILLVLPLAVSMRALRTHWKLPLTVFLAISGTWYLTSWVWMGSAIPDTFVIKAAQRSWGGETFANGVFLFFDRNPAMTIPTVIPPIAGAMALLAASIAAVLHRRIRPELTIFGFAAIGGLLIYAAYGAIGVPPYHWYYVPTVATLSLFLVAFAYTHGGVIRAIGVPAIVVTIAVSGVLVCTRVDTRFPPITTNQASAQQLRELSRDLRALVGDELVELDGEIGTIAYYCQCLLMNDFSDQGIVTARIQEQKMRIPDAARPILDANWYFRDWTQQPQPTRYLLASAIEPGRPGFIQSWRITSQWSGERYYSLYRK